MKARILYDLSMEEFEINSYPNFTPYFVGFVTEGTYIEPIRTKFIPNNIIKEMEIVND